MSELSSDGFPDRAPMRDGNRFSLLVNGCQIFPAMLDAIRAAQHSICLETFIYWSGRIGDEFARALASRARAGVDVRIVLDWVGCRPLKQRLLDIMTNAGVRIRHFRPLRLFSLRRVNHRSHRKILVADGSVGFTGGVGIADKWDGNAMDPDHWRDNHYLVQGPIVADLQRTFLAHWNSDDLPEADDPRFFPSLPAAGATRAQLVAAEPVDGPELIRNSFLQRIAQARRRLAVVTPYFMPGPKLLDALRRARDRGVDVEVLTCGEHIDRSIVRYASRHRWGELLADGIRIHEFTPTLLHAKALIVDDDTLVIGSANFDCRSCRINDEANIVIADQDLTRQHWQLYEQDRARSRSVSREDWKGRTIAQRTKDAAAHLLRDQL